MTQTTWGHGFSGLLQRKVEPEPEGAIGMLLNSIVRKVAP